MSDFSKGVLTGLGTLAFVMYSIWFVWAATVGPKPCLEHVYKEINRDLLKAIVGGVEVKDAE